MSAVMSSNPLVYLIAVVAIVLMWRGLWGLMDQYIFPKNPKLSYWLSFVVGFLILAGSVLFIVPH